MKKIMFLLAVAMYCFSANAQKISADKVPAAVKAAFQKQYPSVAKVKWEKEKESFEAEFKLDKVETSAVFDMAGKLMETEIEIAITALPQAVKDYVSKNHKGAKIKEAAKITDAQGKIMYEAELKGKDLMFDEQGNFIK